MSKFIELILNNKVLLGNIGGSGIFFALVIILSFILDGSQYKEFIIQYSTIQAFSNIGIFGLNSIIIHEYSKNKDPIVLSALLYWFLNCVIFTVIFFIFQENVIEFLSFLNYEIILTGLVFGLLKILIFILIPLKKYSLFFFHNIGIRLLMSLVIIFELFENSTIFLPGNLLILFFIYLLVLIPYLLFRFDGVFSWKTKRVESFCKNAFPFLILGIINLGSGHSLNAIIADKILTEDVKLFSILFQSAIIIPLVFNGLLDQRLLNVFEKLHNNIKFFQIEEVKKMIKSWIVLFGLFTLIGCFFYFNFKSSANFIFVVPFLFVVSLSGFKSFFVNILIFYSKNYLFLILTGIFNFALLFSFNWYYESINLNEILSTYTIILGCYLLTLFIFSNRYESFFR